MIGVGWEDRGSWRFRTFVAEHEDQDEELTLYEDLVNYLQAETNGAILDSARSTLYHWGGAEVWQTRRAADRHGLAQEHPLRRLPWYDLQKVLLDGPGALPGAWNYRLKDVAKALSALDAQFATEWPEYLDEGLHAMVMGWKAYQAPYTDTSTEMAVLQEYLEADCHALWQILRWLRAG
jgi:hypothetical protein